ncbi:MAG: hypothetical protein K8F29_08760 [Kofleriaceae bacterium]|nr:hypothetical protein [Candidatus Methylomirabilis lanthanidiphila]
MVGFNDTGSYLQTFFTPLGLSLNGVARSTNKGSSFTGLGYPNPGPVFSDFLAGDPVVVCSDPNTFYYASLFERTATSDISVSKSIDGGATFGNPISVAGKDAGISWSNKKITKTNFPAVPGQDAKFSRTYMGDYDSPAIDFTHANGGFVGAWGDNSLGNPDVKVGKC